MPLIPVDESALLRGLQWILSAAAGALIAVVTFRTRIVVIEREIIAAKEAEARRERDEVERRKKHDEAMEALEERIRDRLEQFDRRQLFMLQLLSDIAKKVGVDQRLGDTIVQFMTDEAGDRQQRRRGD